MKLRRIFAVLLCLSMTFSMVAALAETNEEPVKISVLGVD